jgi:hypothetical protein
LKLQGDQPAAQLPDDLIVLPDVQGETFQECFGAIVETLRNSASLEDERLEDFETALKQYLGWGQR